MLIDICKNLAHFVRFVIIGQFISVVRIDQRKHVFQLRVKPRVENATTTLVHKLDYPARNGCIQLFVCVRIWTRMERKILCILYDSTLGRQFHLFNSLLDGNFRRKICHVKTPAVWPETVFSIMERIIGYFQHFGNYEDTAGVHICYQKPWPTVFNLWSILLWRRDKHLVFFVHCI